MDLPPDNADDLLAELDLGSARGGRRPSAGPVEISVVRGLTEEDLPRLSEPSIPMPLPTLDSLRSSHHQLAQLIAKGMSQAQAGLITGYAGSYISILVNHDPAFRELLAHYQAEREEVFVDVLERMKTLGLEVNDLLLERIRTDPDKWTNQQLADLHKETVGAMVRGSSGSGTGGGAPAIGELKVVFVTPRTESVESSSARTAAAGPIFDAESVELVPGRGEDE